ncbi:PAS domain-containing protein [Pelomonas sp. CA6]|uniref:sensor histidine kinase n=1 Tax=Pelomonas sp. CA6 TaxID=2907999 RepID=UPI001F4C2ED5|nr:PAS domain-containing protein [Pelomonas sp. CA6]MCH7344759.1 PAS domain-containing protein [Pelomonas sp. CA6]
MFWCADPTRQRLLYVSPSVETLLGLRAEVLLAEPMQWNHAVLPSDADRLPRPFFAEPLAQPAQAVREYRMVGPDLHVGWIRDRRYLWRDPHSGAWRRCGMAEDISELHAWRTARLLLDPGWHAQLAHELRGLLHAVLVWSRVLRQTLNARPLQRQALDTIERNVRAQSGLIGELLDGQLLMSGRLRPALRLFRLPRLLDEVVATLDALARPAGVSLMLQRDPGLRLIRADPERLRAVLLRLMTHLLQRCAGGAALVLRLTRARGELWLSMTTQPDPTASPQQLVLGLEEGGPRRPAEAGRRGHAGLEMAAELVALQGGRLETRLDGQGEVAAFVLCFPDPCPLPPQAAAGRAGAPVP